MSDTRRLYLSLALLLFCVVGCRSYRELKTLSFDMRNPCSGGQPPWPNKQNPIICVDAKNLTVSPDTVEVHNHEEGNPNRSVVVRWFTTNKERPLGIKMDSKDCFIKVICPGTDRCIALTKLDAAGKKCGYNVNLNGEVVDPLVIVEQCCM